MQSRSESTFGSGFGQETKPDVKKDATEGAHTHLGEGEKKPAEKPEPKKEKAKAPKPEEKKEEKPEPPRRNRVTVLRDLVEDLESDSSFSDEQRKAFMELNRRLTRALAR